MNRRILVPAISFAGLMVCLVCVTCLILYYGINFDGGPFSSESRAQFLIRFQGGTRVVFDLDVPPGTTLSPQDLEDEKAIVSNRLRALGLDAVVRVQENCCLVIDVPSNVEPNRITSVMAVGILEFVDAGDTPLAIGQVIQTTGSTGVGAHNGTPSSKVYRTVLTGKYLRSVRAASGQTTNQPHIQFTLTDDGTNILADFTSKNINKYLVIVMDSKVVMSPIIKSPITGGSGIIEGQFTRQEANELVIQLKYGALPFPLKLAETKTISR
ncbi:MAG: hypothetical protein HZB51_23605 [Chloroflexi bacterium]|nr:hypothetical protein [Chloroflexota bacterium]